MNSDGTGQTNLTSTNGIPETAPSWSPNGKQIAFTSGELYDNQDIYVMNTEGTGRTRLAENASSPSFAPRAGEK
jgi:TolB protein